MDGASSAATVLQLIQVATQVSAAFSQYVISVKNAESSRERLANQITIITGAAKIMKAILDSSNTRKNSIYDELIKQWFASDGPPTQCMKTFDDLLKCLSASGNGRMKWGERLTWRWKEKKVNSAIQTFEQYSSYFQTFLKIDLS